MRNGTALILLAMMLAGGAEKARAGHMSARFTRENGMNAVLLKGESYTFRDLVAKRNENTRRFDLNHHRLGYALRLGETELLARQAKNPIRFRHYHPLLSWLLQDITPDGGGGSTGQPDLPPPVEPPPPPPPPPPPSPAGVIPEPSSVAMMGTGLAGVLLVTCRRFRGPFLGRKE